MNSHSNHIIYIKMLINLPDEWRAPAYRHTNIHTYKCLFMWSLQRRHCMQLSPSFCSSFATFKSPLQHIGLQMHQSLFVCVSKCLCGKWFLLLVRSSIDIKICEIWAAILWRTDSKQPVKSAGVILESDWLRNLCVRRT